ncbi:MAG TPA: methylated-DNA--[protein]-cysteine S-methyltransferase [Candidatus Limnocylindrales bacterium]|nr:methylated-DNA--[protein]-cysteine S-methyltransferase [Candidatus Limnocylindrales bacterium]
MPTLVITSLAAPWGPIWIAAGERGLTALDQLVSGDAFVERLQRRFPGARLEAIEAAPRDDLAADHARRGRAAVEAFLAGDLGALETLAVDLADRPAWDRQVLGAVRGIPPGGTASYGGLARMIGKPGAARAVGGAVGRNPVGLAIPCHRVIAGDGTLGGYGGGWWGGRAAGLELKRELLAREGVQIPAPPSR